LVLRYWKGGHGLTNDQIADSVKLPGGGSPIYRIREFFHLVGFDTVRCVASVEHLKRLVDAGYPIIVQQKFSDTAHVVVVIGYDDAEGIVELQDPMTHTITSISMEELNSIRRVFWDSAIVAFPRGLGYDKDLFRMGIHNDPALVWADQAVLAMDENRLQVAAALGQGQCSVIQDLSWPGFIG
jgi:hypothetical protein